VSLDPLSTLGSLGIGALVGAVMTHLLRERAERRREEREREGLLRLVLSETRHNQDLLYRTYVDLSKIEDSALLRALAPIDLFKLDTWNDTRIRLAQLVPSDEFSHLATHYMDLQAAIDAAHTTDRMLGPPREIVGRSLDSTENSRLQVVAVLVRYLGSAAKDNLAAPWKFPEDKEFTLPFGGVQDRTEPQTSSQRSWWRRVFGR
jgi:hypothetical protein